MAPYRWISIKHHIGTKGEHLMNRLGAGRCHGWNAIRESGVPQGHIPGPESFIFSVSLGAACAIAAVLSSDEGYVSLGCLVKPP